MNRRILTGLAAILVSIFIFSCSKDNGNPTIKFVPGPGFTGKDTVMKVNYTLTVALLVNWNGVDALNKLEAKLNDALVESFDLTGESANYNLSITKGTAATEKWTFVVVDAKDNQSEISLTLTKDPNSEYGAILYFSPVGLGAQNNTTKGGFIGFRDLSATTYTLESAFSNQAGIDLFYYSDLLTHATLASPGSDVPADLFPGARNISLWTLKNATRFVKSTMTVSDFNAISNDAPIVNAWNNAQSVSKAGELKANDIWLVKLASGRKGAVLVKTIAGADAGEIQFEIKIQD